MSSTTTLFSYGSIEDHLEQHDASVKRTIDTIDSLADLEKGTENLLASAVVETCALQRSVADFDVTETRDGATVELKVPLSGDTSLLHVDHGGDAVRPYATVHDGRWTDEGPHLKMSKTFPTGSTPESVKAWAKEQVDAIEAAVAFINKKIDEHNGGAEARTRTLIAHRRKVLETGTSLRDGLEDGI